MSSSTSESIQDRLAKLQDWLRQKKRVLVAYSGGVDSTFLAAVAYETLGENMLAVTADIAACPQRLLKKAVDLAGDLGFPHRVIACDQLSFPNFRENTPRRCYHCKVQILQAIRETAREEGFHCLVDGGNVDDMSDYRPGHDAVREFGVESPLQQTGWTKPDIRAASRQLGLPTADMPAFACLATRIPFGQLITLQKLDQVDAVETCLEDLGVRVYRARHHGDCVRIVIGEDDMPILSNPQNREKVVNVAKSVGFEFVTLDLEPYRSGRMNPTTDDARRDD